MSAAAAEAPWTRGGWQWGVEPASAHPRPEDFWRIEGFNEVYGLPMVWAETALPESVPDEGAVGAIDGWREAQRGSDAYLAAVRGVWSGFPDPLSHSLWRMRADETSWRFLGHFDEWPRVWTIGGRAMKPVMNIADVPLRASGDGKGFKAKTGPLGQLIGSPGIGVMLTVVEPGEKAFPFHVHHRNHELFVILEGEGTYRFGDERFAVKAGDVCAAPAGGPDKAHQLINTGATTLKYLGISTREDTEVVEHPDSGKFAVISRFDWANPAAGGIRYVGRKENSLDYFEGEE